MEIEGTEDEVVFLEQTVNKDVSDHQCRPGIVPDGKTIVLKKIGSM
jgi:histone-lysine N-methyltransferase MLL3